MEFQFLTTSESLGTLRILKLNSQILAKQARTQKIIYPLSSPLAVHITHRMIERDNHFIRISNAFNGIDNCPN